MVGGFTNTAFLDQAGHDNDINVLQEDDGNFADIDQAGSDNTIALEQQDNIDSGIVDVNVATLTQESEVTSSDIHVSQRDAENFANVVQTESMD